MNYSLYWFLQGEIRWDQDQLYVPFVPRPDALPIPPVGIFDDACWFKVNPLWMSHVLGCLDALIQPDTWLGTDEEIFLAQQEVYKLMSMMAGCQQVIEDIRLNGCTLEKQIGGEWETVGPVKESLPIGMVFASVADSVAGALLCDGEFYLVEDYPSLVAVLPEVYVDETVFYVPDMRGRVVVGAGDGGITDAPALEVGDNGGEWEHQLTELEMPSHDHDATVRRGPDDIDSRISTARSSGVGVVQSVTPNIFPTGGDQPHNNAQPYEALNYFIVAATDCIRGEDMIMSTFELRQNPDDDCLLEQSHDEGETWSPAFDYSLCQPTSTQNQTIINQNITILKNTYLSNRQTTINNYDGTPGSVDPDAPEDDFDGDGSENRDLALCFAITQFIDAYCEGVLEAYNNNDTIIMTGISFLAGVVAIAFPAFALIPALAGLLVVGWQIWNNAVEEPKFKNLDARKEIVCCMYAALQGTPISQANFANSLSGCDLSSDAEHIIGTLTSGTMTDEGNYLIFLQTLAESWRMAEAGAYLPCPCLATTYCKVWSGTEFANYWTLNGGTTINTDGLRNYLGTDGVTWFISANLPVSGITARRITLKHNSTSKSSTSDVIILIDNDAVLERDSINVGGSQADPIITTWTGSRPVFTRIGIRMDFQNSGLRCYEVEFEFEAESDPFTLTDACS